jgi:hypothetical protein
VVEVGGPDRVRVEVDAAEVDHPDELGGVVDDDLLGGAAGGEAQLDGVDPVRARLGGPLLEEGLLLRPVDEPLQRHRAPVDAAHRALCDCEVVAHQVQLGQPGTRKEHLVRVGDRDLAPGDLEHFLASRHDRHDTPGTRRARP